MSLFLSTFINKVDKKGRVSVPAPFRAALVGQSFQGIVAFPSYKGAMIEACGMDRMELLSKSVDHLDLFSEEHDDLASSLFADAHQLAFDGDGRILLPEALKDFSKIQDEAAFVGRGTTFQIWNPKDFEKYQDDVKSRLRQRGATLKLQTKDN